jgi:hypothetical protein
MGSCKFFEAKGRHGLDNKEVFFLMYIIIVYLLVFPYGQRIVCLCVCVYTHAQIYMTSHVLNCGWLKKQPQLA